MKQMRYVGSDPALQGETALVISYEGGVVLAQFDNAKLPYAIGWSKFRKKDFEEIPLPLCGCMGPDDCISSRAVSGVRCRIEHLPVSRAFKAYD